MNIFRLLSASISTSIFVLIFTCLSCGKNPYADKDNVSASAPQRIISFAPNITEILYELGAGDKVAGVTDFCDYPPEAKQKPKIGDFANFNYEMILRLKPDLAVILKEQRDLIPFFDKYNIRYATAGSDTVDEILESIQNIAEACGVAGAGDSVTQRLRLQINRVSDSAKLSQNRPKILLCVSRDDVGSGVVTKCFAAGAKSFYNQLIEIAGGVNVAADIKQAYPIIGAEAIMLLDPDIVADISSAYSKESLETICGDWKSLKTITAVRADKVRCLSGDYLTIPGPRIFLMLDDLRGILDL